ncbi:MAG: transposase [Candidatus Obscuribacter sp.]|nr:transposase [Candidatus Obscuribacter sp.]
MEYYIECHRKPPKRLVLDFDGSAIETYGVQLNAFYRGGPYGKFMYFPLFVFDENGWLLVAALRPGIMEK